MSGLNGRGLECSREDAAICQEARVTEFARLGFMITLPDITQLCILHHRRATGGRYVKMAIRVILGQGRSPLHYERSRRNPVWRISNLFSIFNASTRSRSQSAKPACLQLLTREV